MQKITSKAVQGAVHSLKVLEFQGLTTFYESVGRGFESLRAHHKRPNHMVTGRFCF